MTPLAAYYLFVAVENERAAQSTHGIDIRARRPLLLDRLLGLAFVRRGQSRLARAA